ncbi:NADPH:quinone reductase [Streptomyces anthocyanicus]|uniref:Zinc-binding oxidoreductase n=3 Tax=Streptomyces TaxID=1883 RepID=Q9RJR7_STRCO|nr:MULTISPECIES: NAD(P)-dependent alcohol dehydrogenase [Streptomyces]QSJ13661.1 zinc-binding oxidoreductase [Streptomyces lividans]AIJ18044.1 zinc-binding oxidoreductase [Streptomyces lividans TK24]EFD71541.1 zinc-binding oxidoreductase [Streptomyces lividans TK24]KKD17356.1 NADPH:quinone reductase [Streptomyces sp. WM6391]MDX2925345.1 NAD(P)-dependent alcohol dehydrogenase [Streptomyces sp. NRRL_B-16638]
MKAVVQERFGPPDSLRLRDVDRPHAGAGQVLVRVHAAAVNPYDWHMLRGDPYVARMLGGMGLTRPKCPVAGLDAAGVVERVGADVRGFGPGDRVLGFCPGAFAEYACTTAPMLVPVPEGLTFEQAAALPMAAVTALRGIRTVGRVRSGQRVLVNGAGGGVGTFAVQIAAVLDAEVTGVCSAANTDLVRSLGAAHVLDYAREDFTDGRGRYDVVLDNVGNHPLRRLRRALTPAGVLVANGGGSPGRVFGAVGAMLRLAAANAVTRQRLRPILPATPDGPVHEDLSAVTALVDAGQVTPVVGRTFALADTARALRHVEEGHARGKTVVTVA